VGTQIGPYQVIKELARGGMGVVYVARHTQLDRIVALKQVFAPRGREASLIRRLEEEARAAARLNHPNIVRVHELLTHDDYPYLVMEFVEGVSLADQLQRGGVMSGRDAAALTVTLSRAVQHAHDCSIVHRDIKPGNVLVAESGRIVLTDFGLARDQDRDQFTKTGTAIGSPGYMPPEQADGDLPAIGPASDVYALGATLYSMLSGRPPFEGSSPIRVLAQILSANPPTFSDLGLAVDPDLETVVMRCLEKAPGDRYASAADLADDLERVLRGDEIFTRPRGGAERARRWLRARAPIVATSLVSTGVLIAAGVAVWTVDPQGQEKPPRVTKPSRARAAGVSTGGVATAGDAEAAREARLSAPLVTLESGAAGESGRVVFVGANTFVSWADATADGYAGGPVRRWVLGDDAHVESWTLGFGCRALQPMRDGSILAAGFAAGGRLKAVRLKAGAIVEGFSELARVQGGVALALRSDHDAVAIARAGELVSVDLLSGHSKTFDVAGAVPAVLRYSLGGRYLLGSSGEGLFSEGSSDDSIRVWDTELPGSGPVTRVRSIGRPYYLDLGPDLRTFAVGTSAGTLFLYDLEDSSAEVRRLVRADRGEDNVIGSTFFKAHSSPIRAGAFSSDGARLYTAGGDPQDATQESGFAIWDLKALAEIRRVVGRGHSIQSLSLSADEAHLVVATSVGQLEVWALR
jgi:predicted Ser/Thr protein kinase